MQFLQKSNLIEVQSLIFYDASLNTIIMSLKQSAALKEEEKNPG